MKVLVLRAPDGETTKSLPTALVLKHSINFPKPLVSQGHVPQYSTSLPFPSACNIAPAEKSKLIFFKKNIFLTE